VKVSPARLLYLPMSGSVSAIPPSECLCDYADDASRAKRRESYRWSGRAAGPALAFQIQIYLHASSFFSS
jgi:hypothetical protein